MSLVVLFGGRKCCGLEKRRGGSQGACGGFVRRRRGSDVAESTLAKSRVLPKQPQGLGFGNKNGLLSPQGSIPKGGSKNVVAFTLIDV